MKSYHSLISLAILIAFFFASCKDDSPVICDPTPQFSADEFVNQIESRLESQPIIGYQFAVNKDGNLYYADTTGLARHDADPGGPVEIIPTTRFNAASIAKFIGAIALLNVMEDNNISLDSDFIDYLPVSWHDTAHFQHQYTFRELLTHQTAINFQSSRTQTEAEMLEALIAPPDPGGNQGYQNGNFCLLRVLIGEIVYGLDETSSTYSIDCTNKYFEYLEQKIFSPLNLDCPRSANEVIAYYNTNTYPWAYQYPLITTYRDVEGFLGWGHSHNVYRTGGAAGLMLSALDIAEIMAFFRHDNSELIISELSRNRILDFELGLFNSITGAYGRYQSKRGTRGPAPDGSIRAIQSILMFFPNGVEAVIITNSRHNALHTLLRDAYDASWINPC